MNEWMNEWMNEQRSSSKQWVDGVGHIELNAKKSFLPYRAMVNIPSKFPGSDRDPGQHQNRTVCYEWDIPALEKNSLEFVNNFLRYQQNMPNFSRIHNGINSFKIRRFGCRFGWLTKNNGDFFLQRYISGKIFMKIRLVVSMWRCLQTNGQETNKQTKQKTPFCLVEVESLRIRNGQD